MTGRRRRRTLLAELRSQRPDIEDAEGAIRAGAVQVEGRYLTNPSAAVPVGAPIVVSRPEPLRGEVKLGAALDHRAVPVAGRIALDVGAAAGGFTLALLARGAARVYAVDAGHGQLLGSLRQDPRVVNLEGTNLGQLSAALVPDAVEVLTVDVSYLSLASAVTQLSERLLLAPGAHLVGLVKPMFELGAGRLPSASAELDEACQRAAAGAAKAGWEVVATMRSAVTGSRGAVEFFVVARWPGAGASHHAPAPGAAGDG